MRRPSPLKELKEPEIHFSCLPCSWGPSLPGVSRVCCRKWPRCDCRVSGSRRASSTLDQPKGTVWGSVGVLLEAPPLLTVLFQHDCFRLLTQSRLLCLWLRAPLAPVLVLARSCALPLPILVPARHAALCPSAADMPLDSPPTSRTVLASQCLQTSARVVLKGLADGAYACFPAHLLSLTSWPLPPDTLHQCTPRPPPHALCLVGAPPACAGPTSHLLEPSLEDAAQTTALL